MELWACASCGGENPGGMRFCGHCGTPRPADVGDSPAAPSPPGPATVPPEPSRPPEPTRPTEERRLITALFADVSGFTALAQRVDTEELQAIIDPIIASLSDVVAAHDGWIEKYAGDALLALFGAPTAHDDDAERALDTAIELHRALELTKADLPEAAAGLTLHVGVNSGHGIARMIGGEGRMDYAVLGDAVITAQRLELAAPAGETYVGAMTVALARGRFALESIGGLDVKGKDEPVPAWRLVGPATPSDAPSPGIETVRPRLVGRAREMQTLRAAIAVDGSTDGRAGTALALVVGEAGAGKSTLVEAIRGEATAAGRRWLQTRCLSYGAALGYRPIAELLRSWAGVDLEDRPEVAGPTLGAALARLGLGYRIAALSRLAGLSAPAGSAAGPEDDALTGLDPEGLRRALHDAFLDWLERLAVDAPLAVHVEDVHWADPSTVALVVEAVDFIVEETLPIVIIATSRDDGGAAASRISSLPSAERIALGPFDALAVADLTADILEAPPPQGLAGDPGRADRGQPAVRRVHGSRARRRGGPPS